MRRTTIKLPDDLDARLRLEASRSGRTLSELTREAIAAYLEDGPVREFRAAGIGDSGLGDVSRRIDHYLEVHGYGDDA